MHIPVLLEAIKNCFQAVKLTHFLDATVGAGGHASAILSDHAEIQTYIAVDQDPTARELAKIKLKPWTDKLVLIPDNFSRLDQHQENLPPEGFDGILADLGVSSMQLDTAERGFSFQSDGPLDMRMDQDASLTAEEIVNAYSEQELGRILRTGEVKRWRAIARRIVERRKEAPIRTTQALCNLLMPLFYREKKKGGIHPLTLTFQALRMEVNHELEVLSDFLDHALTLLKPGGRLAVITFHSLEDRIVKQRFQQEASDKVSTSGRGGMFLDKDPTVKLLTRKPIQADEEEITLNPRSRSAKLRIIEKI